jgi:hypothetical protein
MKSGEEERDKKIRDREGGRGGKTTQRNWAEKGRDRKQLQKREKSSNKKIS